MSVLVEKMKSLYEERNKVVEDLRAVVTAGDGDLSAEEREKMDKAQADFDALSERIKRTQAAIDAEAAVEEGQRWAEERERKGNESRGRQTPHDGGGSAAPEERRTYSQVVTDYLRTFRDGHGDMAEIRAFTDDSLNIGTVGDGGYLIPDEWENEILRLAGDVTVMRSLATVRQTSQGTFEKPIRTSTPGASYTAEKGDYNRANMAFELFQVDVHKMTSEVPVTEEMLNDARFDLQAEVQQAVGEDVGELSEDWYVTGTGTNQAYGVVTGAGAGVTATGTSAITMDEIKSLPFELSRRYRNGRSTGFLMNKSTFLALSLLKDGSQRYLMEVDPKQRTQRVVDGYPVYESDSMANIAASSVPIVFGDFSYYMIADRQSTFQVDPYSAGNQGVILFRAMMRTGGKLQTSEAVKKLTMAAT